MDPNENIREQREIANRVIIGKAKKGDLEELAELVLALDKWLREGGFLPERWTPA